MSQQQTPSQQEQVRQQYDNIDRLIQEQAKAIACLEESIKHQTSSLLKFKLF